MNDTSKKYVKTDAAAPESANSSMSPFVAMTAGDILRTLMVGVGVGAVSLGLFYVMNRFIFGAALCRAGVEGCLNAPLYSAIIATIVGVFAGIVALAKVSIYRPLPAAIAVSIAMWGVLGVMSTNVAWYWGLLIGSVLFGLAYLLFVWLARIRSFIVSMIVLMVAVIVIRIVIG